MNSKRNINYINGEDKYNWKPPKPRKVTNEYGEEIKLSTGELKIYDKIDKYKKKIRIQKRRNPSNHHNVYESVYENMLKNRHTITR